MLEIIDAIYILLLYLFDNYIVSKYMKTFFFECNYNKKFLHIAYGVKIIIAYLGTCIAPYPIINTIIFFSVILLIACCYEAKIINKIVSTFYVFALKILAELIVSFLLVGIGEVVFKERAYNDNYIGLFFSLIIFLCLALLVERFKHVNNKSAVPKPFLITVAVISITTIALETILLQQENLKQEIFILSMILSLTIFFVMVFLHDSLGTIYQEKVKSGILMAEKEYYVKHAEKIHDNDSELRKFRHDISNRLNVIEELIDKNDKDNALKYISGMISKINDIKVYSQSGNVIIDSIINYKLSQAVDNGIEVITDIRISNDIRLLEDDMVVILGNLLDNAIEAVSKLNDNRYIRFMIKEEKSSIFLEVINSYDSKISIVGNKFKTTKPDKELHGIGLLSVEDIVKKYSGRIDFKHDDREFCVNVILYI